MRKRLFVTCWMVFISVHGLLAQNVGIGTTSPDASAKVDIQSTVSGILIPRMSSVHRAAISTPATGLLVFDSDTDSFWFYDGVNWVELLADYLSRIRDGDDDTWIDVEMTPDEDKIRLSADGREMIKIGMNQNRITAIVIADTGQNILIGDSAGYSLQRNIFANANGTGNIYIGQAAGMSQTYPIGSIMIGYHAGRNNNTASGMLAIGYEAGKHATNSSNATIVGNNAGTNITTGTWNTFVGSNAGYDDSSGWANTYVGFAAGAVSPNSSQNVFIGIQSGERSGGDRNVAIGRASGFFPGSDNVFIGHFTGRNAYTGGTIGVTTLGDSNVIIGSYAGNHYEQGGSVFIGYRAGQDETSGNRLYIHNNESTSPLLYGEFDNRYLRINGQGETRNDGMVSTQTIVHALVSNTSNRPTLLFSENATTNITDGMSIEYDGTGSGVNNKMYINDITGSAVATVTSGGSVGIGTTSPLFNLHVGDGTMTGSNVSDTRVVVSDNTNDNRAAFLTLAKDAVGNKIEGQFESDGQFNDAIIFGSTTTHPIFIRTGNANRMYIGTTGNVGIGTTGPNQLLEVSKAGYSATRITSTNANIASLEFLRTGNGFSDWRIVNSGGLLLIGQSSDDLSTVTDVVRMGGSSLTPATDNFVTLGNSGLRWTAVYAINGTIQTSDARDKKDIAPLDYGLAELRQLKPITYQWKDGRFPEKKIGLIAQDLQMVIPEAVADWEWKEDPETGERQRVDAEKLGIYYSDLIPVLIKSIQELDTKASEIEDLKVQLRDLQQEVEALKNNTR